MSSNIYYIFKPRIETILCFDRLFNNYEVEYSYSMCDTCHNSTACFVVQLFSWSEYIWLIDS